MAVQDIFNVYQPTINKPVELNTYNKLSRSLAVAEDRRYKAADANAGIDLLFNNVGQQLHQDAETASWFEGFKNKYKGEVDNYLLSGDYGNAIFYAKQAAAKAAQDPELLARIESNSEYQTQKKAVDSLFASGKIDQVTRDRWLDQNKYHFDAVKNNVGEVIGGKGFTANWMPVMQQDMSKFYADLKSLLGTEKGSYEDVVFLGEDNKEYSTPPAGKFSVAFKKGGSYERLSADKLRRGFHELLDGMPEYKAYFEQDYKNRLWQYDKASDEEKTSFYGSDIKDVNGRDYDLYTYISKRVNPMLNDMSYNHSSSSTNYDTAYNSIANYRQAQLKAQLQGQDNSPFTDIFSNIKTTGQNIEYPMTEAVENSYRHLSNNLKTITDLVDDINVKTRSGKSVTGSAIFNNPGLKQLLTNGDYGKVSDYLNNALRPYWKQLSNSDRDKLATAISNLKEEGNDFSGYLSKFENKQDRDAIIASVALTGGLNVHNIDNNELAKKYISTENKIFKNKNKSYDNIVITALYDGAFNKLFNNLGGTDESIAYKYGILKTNVGGRTAYTFNRNNPNLRTILKALSKINNTTWTHPNGLFNYWHNDENNKLIPNNSIVSSLDSLSDINDKIDIMSENAMFTDDFRKQVSKVKSIEPITILPITDYWQATAANMGINEKNAHGDPKTLTGQIMTSISGGLQNFEVYVGGVKQKDSDKDDLKNLIERAYDDGRITENNVNFAYDKTTGTCGIVIRTGVSTKGNAKAEDKNSQQIYIKGLMSSIANKAFTESPAFKYMCTAFRKKSFDVKEKDFIGNDVKWEAEESGTYLSIKEDANKLLTNIVAMGLDDSNLLPYVDLRNEVTKILNQNGITDPSINTQSVSSPIELDNLSKRYNLYIKYREGVVKYIQDEFNKRFK